MQTKVSTKGQVVLPGAIRRRLGIQTGDPLHAEVKDGRIILTPQSKRPHAVRIVRDPRTGLPALSAGPKARKLTHREVKDILSDFP